MGYAFGIFMAHVGTLRTFGVPAPLTLGVSPPSCSTHAITPELHQILTCVSMNGNIMDDRKNVDQFDPLRVSESDIYQFLTLQWQHQNELSWTKLNVMLALETAVLAGSFSVPDWKLGCILLAIGTMVGFILYKLVRRDWHVRDYHLSLLDKVHAHIKFEFSDGELGPILMIPPARSRTENGQILLRTLFMILLVTNTVAILYLAYKPNLPTPATVAVANCANTALQRDAPQAARP